MSEILDAIYRRRSIREFTDEKVDQGLLHEIIRAGTWAPSGLNNQPWRFVVVQNTALREELAELTHYGHVVRSAPALIAVYLDQEAMYDTVKDHMGIGACIQNMLLAVEACGLGAVWLGEILKNRQEVNRVFSLGQRYALMAVLAIGHPLHRDQKSTRKEIEEVVLVEFL